MVTRVLVDRAGNARLAGFGLLTIHLDSTTTSSRGEGGPSRWMSPELFDPERFGAKDNRRTKSSDCYALGMVAYEVLTGRVPFSLLSKYAAIAKVLRGEWPERPQGAEGGWFTDDVWGILGRCWQPKPRDRPSIKDVLRPLPLVNVPQQLDLSSWTLSELSIGDGADDE